MNRTARFRAYLGLPIALGSTLAVALPDSARAQVADSVQLRGRVTDQAAQPIHDARVLVTGTGGRATHTLGDGRFQFWVPATDSVHLLVTAIGYVAVPRTVVLTAATATEHLTLVHAVYSVPEITVTAPRPTSSR